MFQLTKPVFRPTRHVKSTKDDSATGGDGGQDQSQGDDSASRGQSASYAAGTILLPDASKLRPSYAPCMAEMIGLSELVSDRVEWFSDELPRLSAYLLKKLEKSAAKEGKHGEGDQGMEGGDQSGQGLVSGGASPGEGRMSNLPVSGFARSRVLARSQGLAGNRSRGNGRKGSLSGDGQAGGLAGLSLQAGQTGEETDAAGQVQVKRSRVKQQQQPQGSNVPGGESKGAGASSETGPGGRARPPKPPVDKKLVGLRQKWVSSVSFPLEDTLLFSKRGVFRLGSPAASVKFVFPPEKVWTYGPLRKGAGVHETLAMTRASSERKVLRVPEDQGGLADELFAAWSFFASFSVWLRLSPFTLDSFIDCVFSSSPTPLTVSVYTCLLTILIPELLQTLEKLLEAAAQAEGVLLKNRNKARLLGEQFTAFKGLLYTSHSVLVSLVDPSTSHVGLQEKEIPFILSTMVKAFLVFEGIDPRRDFLNSSCFPFERSWDESNGSNSSSAGRSQDGESASSGEPTSNESNGSNESSSRIGSAGSADGSGSLHSAFGNKSLSTDDASSSEQAAQLVRERLWMILEHQPYGQWDAGTKIRLFQFLINQVKNSSNFKRFIDLACDARFFLNSEVSAAAKEERKLSHEMVLAAYRAQLRLPRWASQVMKQGDWFREVKNEKLKSEKSSVGGSQVSGSKGGSIFSASSGEEALSLRDELLKARYLAQRRMDSWYSVRPEILGFDRHHSVYFQLPFARKVLFVRSVVNKRVSYGQFESSASWDKLIASLDERGLREQALKPALLAARMRHGGEFVADEFLKSTCSEGFPVWSGTSLRWHEDAHSYVNLYSPQTSDGPNGEQSADSQDNEQRGDITEAPLSADEEIAELVFAESFDRASGDNRSPSRAGKDEHQNGEEASDYAEATQVSAQERPGSLAVKSLWKVLALSYSHLRQAADSVMMPSVIKRLAGTAAVDSSGDVDMNSHESQDQAIPRSVMHMVNKGPIDPYLESVASNLATLNSVIQAGIDRRRLHFSDFAGQCQYASVSQCLAFLPNLVASSVPAGGSISSASLLSLCGLHSLAPSSLPRPEYGLTESLLVLEDLIHLGLTHGASAAAGVWLTPCERILFRKFLGDETMTLNTFMIEELISDSADTASSEDGNESGDENSWNPTGSGSRNGLTIGTYACKVCGLTFVKQVAFDLHLSRSLRCKSTGGPGARIKPKPAPGYVAVCTAVECFGQTSNSGNSGSTATPGQPSSGSSFVSTIRDISYAVSIANLSTPNTTSDLPALTIAADPSNKLPGSSLGGQPVPAVVTGQDANEGLSEPKSENGIEDPNSGSTASVATPSKAGYVNLCEVCLRTFPNGQGLYVHQTRFCIPELVSKCFAAASTKSGSGAKGSGSSSSTSASASSVQLSTTETLMASIGKFLQPCDWAITASLGVPQDTASPYVCEFCCKELPTLQGLQLHLNRWCKSARSESEASGRKGGAGRGGPNKHMLLPNYVTQCLTSPPEDSNYVVGNAQLHVPLSSQSANDSVPASWSNSAAYSLVKRSDYGREASYTYARTYSAIAFAVRWYTARLAAHVNARDRHASHHEQRHERSRV